MIDCRNKGGSEPSRPYLGSTPVVSSLKLVLLKFEGFLSFPLSFSLPPGLTVLPDLAPRNQTRDEASL